MNEIKIAQSERALLKDDEKYNDEVSAVYKTNDYNLFTNISGNRVINVLHLKRLKTSMKERYLRIPIIVNEKFGIIDGQHRFLNCMELGLPVFYIVNKGYQLAEVQRLNSNSSNWGMNDYMDGYVDMGYVDYIKYKEYREKFGFSHTETRGILSGTKSKESSIQFKSGEFKITHEEEFLSVARKIMEMKPYYKGYKRRSFVAAMLALFRNPRFNFDVFLKRLPHQKGKIEDFNTRKEYLTAIEDIYNYNSHDPQYLRGSK